MSKEKIAQDYRKKGRAYLDRRNFTEAISILKKGLELDDKDSDLHNDIAEVYFKTHDFINSELHAQNAIANDRNGPKGYFQAARAARSQGNKPKFYKYLNEALCNCPKSEELNELFFSVQEDDSEREEKSHDDQIVSEDVPELVSDSDSDDSGKNEKLQKQSTSQVDPSCTSVTIKEEVPDLVSDSDSEYNANNEKLRSRSTSRMDKSSSSVSDKAANANQRSMSMSRTDSVNSSKSTSKKKSKKKKGSIELEDIRQDTFLPLLESIKKEQGFQPITPEQFWATNRKEFQSLLKEGYEVLASGLPRKAIEKYKAALDMILQHSIEDFKLKEIDFVVLKYTMSVAWIELANYADLTKAIEYLLEIEATRASKFPAVFYGLGSAYYKLNRFKTATEHLEKGLLFLSREVKFEVQSWPGTNTVIPETTRSGLKDVLKELLKTCRAYHEPDAICRYSECLDLSSHIIPSEHIFYSDPDFCGFVVVICEEKCKIEYHIGCWKVYKESTSSDEIGKLSDKDFIGRPCPTTDCLNQLNERSVIVKIEIIGDDTTVKTSIEAPKVELKKIKKKKTERCIEVPVQEKPKAKTRPKAKKNISGPVQPSPQQDIVQTNNSNSAEELENRLKKLGHLRDVNFGFANDRHWNPRKKFYGHSDIQDLDHFLIPDFIEDYDTVKAKKEFIFSYFFEYIRNEGPQKMKDVERKWLDECEEFEDVNVLKINNNICNFLLQSYRFASIDDYICLADQLPDTYMMAKTELVESLSFTLIGHAKFINSISNHTNITNDTATSHTNITNDTTTNYTNITNDSATNHTNITNDNATNHTNITNDTAINYTEECNYLTCISEKIVESHMNTDKASSNIDSEGIQVNTSDSSTLEGFEVIDSPSIDALKYMVESRKTQVSTSESIVSEGELVEAYISENETSESINEGEVNDANETIMKQEGGGSRDEINHYQDLDVNTVPNTDIIQSAEETSEENIIESSDASVSNTLESEEKGVTVVNEESRNEEVSEEKIIESIDSSTNSKLEPEEQAVTSSPLVENMKLGNEDYKSSNSILEERVKSEENKDQCTDSLLKEKEWSAVETEEKRNSCDDSHLGKRVQSEVTELSNALRETNLDTTVAHSLDQKNFSPYKKWSTENGETRPSSQLTCIFNQSVVAPQLPQPVSYLSPYIPLVAPAPPTVLPVQLPKCGDIGVQTDDDTKQFEATICNLQSTIKKLEKDVENQKKENEIVKKTSSLELRKQQNRIQELEIELSNCKEERKKDVKHWEEKCKKQEENFKAEKSKLEKLKCEIESNGNEKMRDLISDTGKQIKALEEKISLYRQHLLKKDKETGEFKIDMNKKKCMEKLIALKNRKEKGSTDSNNHCKTGITSAIQNLEDYLKRLIEYEVQFQIHCASVNEKLDDITSGDLIFTNWPEPPIVPDYAVEDIALNVTEENVNTGNKLIAQSKESSDLKEKVADGRSISQSNAQKMKVGNDKDAEPERSSKLSELTDVKSKLAASSDDKKIPQKIIELNHVQNGNLKNPSAGIPVYPQSHVPPQGFRFAAPPYYNSNQPYYPASGQLNLGQQSPTSRSWSAQFQFSVPQALEKETQAAEPVIRETKPSAGTLKTLVSSAKVKEQKIEKKIEQKIDPIGTQPKKEASVPSEKESDKSVPEKKKSTSPASEVTPLDVPKSSVATTGILNQLPKATQNVSSTKPVSKVKELPLTIAPGSTLEQNVNNTVVAPKLKTGGSYHKLMTHLRKNFPLKSEQELATGVAIVRERNNNSLSGLSVPNIITMVDKVLKEKVNKKQGSMGLDKFGAAAWSGVRESATNWSKPKENTEDECVICMETLVRDKTSLHCKHTFHTKCIRQWLRAESICPICRVFTRMVDEFPPLT